MLCGLCFGFHIRRQECQERQRRQKQSILVHFNSIRFNERVCVYATVSGYSIPLHAETWNDEMTKTGTRFNQQPVNPKKVVTK